MREEILSAERDPEIDEESVEGGLRPRSLQEFVGQSELKGHLRVMLEAARRRVAELEAEVKAASDGAAEARVAHQNGVRALEAAAASRNLRALAQRHAVDLSALRALRMRWGNRL